jgi:hypothetical protein
MTRILGKTGRVEPPSGSVPPTPVAGSGQIQRQPTAAERAEWEAQTLGELPGAAKLSSRKFPKPPRGKAGKAVNVKRQ